MPYTPNIRITQPNVYSFVFEDLNFLADVPTAITSLTLTVTSSDNTTMDDVEVDLEVAGMTTTSQSATITNTMLGLDADEAIPDDKYTMLYTYNFTSNNSPNDNLTEEHVLVGNAEEYLYEQFADINQEFFENNPLRSQYVNELVAAYALLKALKIAAATGYTTEHDRILESLARLEIFSNFEF